MLGLKLIATISENDYFISFHFILFYLFCFVLFCFVFQTGFLCVALALLEFILQTRLALETFHILTMFFSGLGTLVQTYVNAINSGTVPCLENAVTTLAQRENSIAVQKAADHYSEQMAQRMRLPSDMLQRLLMVTQPVRRKSLLSSQL